MTSSRDSRIKIGNDLVNINGIQIQIIAPVVGDPNACTTCSQRSEETVVLLFGWLGAKKRALNRYFHLYLNNGYSVIYIPGNVWNFMWFPVCKNFVLSLLNLLVSDQRFSVYSRILVHSLSIGSYVFCHCVSFARKDSRFAPFLSKVRGVIFDSITYGSYDYMQRGVVKGILKGRLQRKLAMKMLPLFFYLFRHYTVTVFEELMQKVEQQPLMVPTMLLYSKNDPMCEWNVVDSMAKYWKRLELPLLHKCWEKSAHVSHLKLHAVEYLSLWEKFMEMVHNNKDTSVNRKNITCRSKL